MKKIICDICGVRINKTNWPFDYSYFQVTKNGPVIESFYICGKCMAEIRNKYPNTDEKKPNRVLEAFVRMLEGE